MTNENTVKNIAKWTALGAFFLVPLTPLIVANSYFFPFITGKAFYFRILIEIAVAGWAVLALLDKEYRPRFSWIGAAVTAFVVWMFVADAFAPNAAKAFWSNFERMEGWVLLIHLLGFFFAASAVLRKEVKWRAWFLTSLCASLVISGYALLQISGSLAIHQGSTRIDATFGNSAYLAIYFLFNVFIALWLALTEKISWLKWSLVALAVLEGVLLFFTETRGAILALLGALALAALLTVFTAGKRARRFAVIGLTLLALASAAFYTARTSTFVQNSPALARIAATSYADGSTRFTIWQMALRGALERPLTGWGQEGFNYVFNKYYDPSLYQQEPWFDRAHNAFIDWLSAGGLPGFLLYLSLFGSALCLLWRHSELSRPERIALTAAVVGYAIHNLFVFDNLYSYIYFFALLALVDSQVARPIAKLERAPELDSSLGTAYALPVAAVAAIGLIWFVNVSGMQTASRLITAMTPTSAGIKANIAAFTDLAAHSSFAGQEVREQIVSFAAAVSQSTQATNEEKQQAVTLAITEMQKQVAAYPLDAREHLQLSYAYRAAGDGANALKEIESAIALSPKKEGFWIEAGALAWDIGDAKAAQTSFATAYKLGPQFPALAVYAAAGNLAVGDTAAADAILLKTFGTTEVDNDVLAVAYYRTKDWPRLIGLWKARATKPGAPVESWFSLAAAYYMSGDKADAVATITKAVALYPAAAASGAAAIKQIEAGK
ncbi:MAG: O-antigen ligase family protein [Candidatus Pacebacteria bacterium]|nr:O-antigen ligase family protein [Candidatus Paceibacterota bacterium]